ncbi:MAG: beta-propeller fold lactonase family protein, partial [Armatimonadia bacterium]|nr:beta-propeller fold lactonase family protein [Armatimonadia bacterium]
MRWSVCCQHANGEWVNRRMRRRLVSLCAIMSLVAVAHPVLGDDTTMTTDPMLVLVGTYTGSGSEGIYTLRMDPASGQLERVAAQGGITNPSFLAVHPSLDYVYAVQETGEDNAVFAYRLGRATGELTPLGSRPAHGAAPCHLTVDPSGSAVIVANYSAGTLAVFRVQDDGSLSEATQVIQHEGSGPD